MTSHPPLTGAQRWLITVSLAMATFMMVLDSSIANVAIPTISGNLGTSVNQGTWVVTSFAVANAISVPITGWLARRYGEVRVFMVSALGFIVASALCGLSQSLEMLIFFRVLQGGISGPLIPLSQSLLLPCYPRDKQGAGTGAVGDDGGGGADFRADSRRLDFRQLALERHFLHQRADRHPGAVGRLADPAPSRD